MADWISKRHLPVTHTRNVRKVPRFWLAVLFRVGLWYSSIRRVLRSRSGGRPGRDCCQERGSLCLRILEFRHRPQLVKRCFVSSGWATGCCANYNSTSAHFEALRGENHSAKFCKAACRLRLHDQRCRSWRIAYSKVASAFYGPFSSLPSVPWWHTRADCRAGKTSRRNVCFGYSGGADGFNADNLDSGSVADDFVNGRGLISLPGFLGNINSSSLKRDVGVKDGSSCFLNRVG